MARVIVIGGGIGGLTTAIAFCRKDWDVSVHEATPKLRPIGKGIWVPINAMQVLGRLGLAEHISEIGWPLQSIELRTASGTLLSALKLNELTARYGYSIISIHRADLVEILANVLQPGVLHLGSQFTHFTQESTQVRAHRQGRIGRDRRSPCGRRRHTLACSGTAVSSGDPSLQRSDMFPWHFGNRPSRHSCLHLPRGLGRKKSFWIFRCRATACLLVRSPVIPARRRGLSRFENGTVA
jgi:2-polyprenyl-6-methoxyphenol hydroxylase-like FAD-dependent oxidoreductase